MSSMSSDQNRIRSVFGRSRIHQIPPSAFCGSWGSGWMPVLKRQRRRWSWMPNTSMWFQCSQKPCTVLNDPTLVMPLSTFSAQNVQSFSKRSSCSSSGLPVLGPSTRVEDPGRDMGEIGTSTSSGEEAVRENRFSARGEPGVLNLRRRSVTSVDGWPRASTWMDTRRALMVTCETSSALSSPIDSITRFMNIAAGIDLRRASNRSAVSSTSRSSSGSSTSSSSWGPCMLGNIWAGIDFRRKSGDDKDRPS
mmetsp:Transcript_73175/g.128951  ORF Transcript_73175/g.128951 Transcript_73175/m.128951 type:complete len:250 (+) Transcript_73175:1918-2667(+)